MTEEILDMMNERRIKKNRNENRYGEINMEIQRKIREAKGTCNIDKCQKIKRLQ